MDADERLALEAELAAELATLDVEDDEECEIDDDALRDDVYVRLDVDELLVRVAAADNERSNKYDDGSARDDSGFTLAMSWTLLRATVEHSDADFFQFIQQDLHELQTTILQVPLATSAAPATAAIERVVSSQDSEGDAVSAIEQQQEHVVEPPWSSPRLSVSATAALDTDLEATTSPPHHAPPVTLTPELSISLETERSAPRATDAFVHSVRSPPPSTWSDAPASAADAARPVPLTPQATDLPTLEIASDQQQLIAAQTQVQLQAIEAQHAARQERLLRAQDARQREHELLARHVREMEAQVAALEAEQQRAANAQAQASERLAMQREETATCVFIAAVRQRKELQLMVQEEQHSRSVHALERDAERAQQCERQAMATEEVHERKRLHLEAERVRRERLAEEKCVLRRSYNTVIAQLVAHAEARAAEQARQVLAARKREARESTQMRSEELWTRRVLAQQRALRDEQLRRCEREAMATEDAIGQTRAAARRARRACEHRHMEEEDALARAIQRAAEQRAMDWHRLLLAREEELSRRAQVLELQRQRARVTQADVCRSLLVHRTRIGYLRLALERWRRDTAAAREHEEARAAAASRLQRFYRTQRVQRQQQQPPSDLLVDSPASAAAAMVLQSTFRGFSIRRKFAHALAMATLVGDDDDLRAYDEVNLDDLIERPPELDDGWEDPVLLVSPGHCQQTQRQSPAPEDASGASDEEEEDERHETGDAKSRSDEREHDAVPSTRRIPPTSARSIALPVAPAMATTPFEVEPSAKQPPATLASALWDKMRKMKQKQRHAIDERTRAQDPAYRLQKLLKTTTTQKPAAKTTNNSNSSSHGSAQPAAAPPTIAWGSSSGEKKRPKVKLPSLVERLRNKTEAAR